MKSPPKNLPIWERMPKEHDRQFFAFCCYRDQIPGCRTIIAAWRAFCEHTGNKKGALSPRPHRAFQEWVGKWDWRERVAAFDRSKRDEGMAQLDGRRQDILIQSWNLLEEIYRIQKANLGGASFDERTRLANSLRETIKTFQETGGAPKGLEVIWNLGPLREEGPDEKSAS